MPGSGFGPGPGGLPPGFNPNAHYHFRPTMRPMTGYVPDGDDALVGTISRMWINTNFTFKQAFQRKGIVRGLPLAFRTLISGDLRKQAFEGKLAVYDKQYGENRITDAQCKIRKVNAAKKYYGYFLKTGYFTLNEYQYYVNKFANSLGVQYIDDVHTHGRVR